jgi:hypothetical protein
MSDIPRELIAAKRLGNAILYPHPLMTCNEAMVLEFIRLISCVHITFWITDTYGSWLDIGHLIANSMKRLWQNSGAPTVLSLEFQ